MITRAWIRPLADADGEVAELGDNGASLSRLATAGFPVPEGFCVTTAAFEGAVGGRPADDASGEEAARWIVGRLSPGSTG